MYLYDKQNIGDSYEIFDVIELTLSSQKIDTVEPIKVAWSMEETGET